MRYDNDSGKILISVSELVAVARRGISPTLPLDEDEPHITSPSLAIRREALGAKEAVPLRIGFTAYEYEYELVGSTDSICEDCLHIVRAISSSPEKPRREEREQVEGESFILAYMYATLSGIENLSLNITYTNENSGESATSVTKIDLKSLKKFFEKCILTVGKYAKPERERVTMRLPTMRALRFPYDKIRDGQSELVRSVYRTLARGTTLYACAPTGTGKTVSMIYPALRLIGEGKSEKLFYLTPKTTTAEAAIDCLHLFERGGAIIRAIRLFSKERSCIHGMSCKRKRSLCPYAECNKIADATLALYSLEKTVVTLEDVIRVAREYAVCPHELMLSYSELCDVVICDMNYLFDPRVYIRRFFTAGGRYSFLIDEAHNLADRAREMYTATLDLGELRELCDDPLIPECSEIKQHGVGLIEEMRAILYQYVKEELIRDKDDVLVGATHLSYAPDELYPIALGLVECFDADCKRAQRENGDEAEACAQLLRDGLYEVRRFSDTLAGFDEGYRTFIFYRDDSIEIRLFAVDPSAKISEMVSRGHGAVFFSATLSPLDYYKSVLGGDGTADTLEVLSPFASEALSVSIVDKISTRYSERERTLPAVSRAIAAALSPRRGNYMVFAPSFEYLGLIAKNFRERYPQITVLEQRRDMTPEEKDNFLKAFEAESESYLVGFCVMGGIYSEGVDLAGDSLIGAIVVGIGMPSLSYEREAMTEYYDEKFEAGRLYAYIYPGMNKVLQAAGRVIRREDDRGIIVLIDDRFDDPVYKKVIPTLWRGMEYVGDAKALNKRIKDFWREVDEERG